MQKLLFHMFKKMCSVVVLLWCTCVQLMLIF